MCCLTKSTGATCYGQHILALYSAASTAALHHAAVHLRILLSAAPLPMAAAPLPMAADMPTPSTVGTAAYY